MNLINIAAFLSTVFGIFTVIPYLFSIIKGKTKPHQLTWLVFTIMNGILLFSQYFEGGRASILITLIFFIGSTLIFILSLKFGIRDSSKWDRTLFLFAILTIIVWVLTKNNTVAIWLTILIDLAATSMMILKIKVDPNSEDPFPWLIGTIAYVFACITLFGKPFGILYVRPFYGLFIEIFIAIFIFYCKSKSSKK